MKRRFRAEPGKRIVTSTKIVSDSHSVEDFFSLPSNQQLSYAGKTRDVDLLERLSENEDEFIRSTIAKNEATPAEILEKLSKDSSWYVRSSVAKNKSCSEDLLERLSTDDNGSVRDTVARYSTNPDTLAKLAEDADSGIRSSVARNPAASAKTLAKLSDESSHIIREGVAGNPSADARTLEKLASDELKNVRYAVSKNPSFKDTRKMSSSWEKLITDLELDCENGDPLYEDTPAGSKIMDLCHQVEDKLGLYVEPSVQVGMGGVWIYDSDNSTVVEDYDFETFDDEIIELAIQSKSEADFRNAYQNYLEGLIS